MRREAVFALGQIGAKRAGPLLLPRLADRDGEVVLLVLEALGKLGDKANTRHVARYLGAANATERATAAVALWRLADSTALDPLLGAITTTPIPRCAGACSMRSRRSWRPIAWC